MTVSKNMKDKERYSYYSAEEEKKNKNNTVVVLFSQSRSFLREREGYFFIQNNKQTVNYNQRHTCNTCKGENATRIMINKYILFEKSTQLFSFWLLFFTG